PTETYTLSLHDALPICNFVRVRVFKEASEKRGSRQTRSNSAMKTIRSIAAALVSTLLLGNLVFAQGTINQREKRQIPSKRVETKDRKSTRLNSSHDQIS